jgi:class 3 adenylate cyclase
MSLRYKLFAAFLLVAVIATVSAGYIGYTDSRDSLEAAISNHLTGLREAKAEQITTYFHGIDNEVKLVGLSTATIEATREFRDAYRQIDAAKTDPKIKVSVTHYYQSTYLPQLRTWLGTEPLLADYLPVSEAPFALQERYIVNNPYPPGQKQLLDSSGVNDAYDAAHKTWHPRFRRMVEMAGFHDLILIDAETKREIYSVKKLPDFGTSLDTGPYRGSCLAQVVAACSDGSQGPGFTSFKDFTAYPASDGAPAAFIATPIYDDNKLIGVLALQISRDEIDRIMTDGCNWVRDGLGKTGEAYLVGPDKLMRSSSRFFLQDSEAYYADLRQAGVNAETIRAIQRNGTPVLQQEVHNKAVTAALNGVSGNDVTKGYRGTPLLTSYQPIKVLGVTWVLIAKMDQAEAFAPVESLRHKLRILGLCILVGVLILSGWLVMRLMRPIKALTGGAQKMSLGDHSVRVPVESSDELGQLSKAFNEMASRIEEKSAALEQKNRENETLLLNILPEPIANRLRGGEQGIADQFAEVSVLFADIVGFTALAGTVPANEIVELLNGLFTRFDVAAQQLEIEKIKTIGDCYMAVCGLPAANKNHAQRMVQMAVRMVHIAREYGSDRAVKLQLRIGVNSGPVVAGVIGQNKFIYDLWGDTVNIASRMESHGIPDAVQVTRGVYEALKDQFPFKARGEIEVRGKGKIETWTLEC